MKRTLSPEGRLNEEGRQNCAAYRELDDKCRQCALHGAYRFCKEFRPTKAEKPKGGLF